MPGDVSGTIDTETTRINASGNPQEVSVSAPKSLGEELRLNADEARVEAARDGEELTGADAIAVINQTWGDLNNKRDDAYVKVVPFPNAVAPAAEPTIEGARETAVVTQASVIDAPVQPGLEPTEQSLIELELSRNGKNPGLVEPAMAETATSTASLNKPDQEINLDDRLRTISKSVKENSLQPTLLQRTRRKAMSYIKREAVPPTEKQLITKKPMQAK